MPSRKLILLRVEAPQVPSKPGDVSELDIPMELKTDFTDWKIVSHDLTIHSLDGSAILSLVVEKA